MEETLLKSLEHAPSLLAMVIIVITFVRFMKYMIEIQHEKDKEYSKTMATLVEKHSDTEARSNDSRVLLAGNMFTNTQATKELTEAVRGAACKYQPKNH